MKVSKRFLLCMVSIIGVGCSTLEADVAEFIVESCADVQPVIEQITAVCAALPAKDVVVEVKKRQVEPQ